MERAISMAIPSGVRLWAAMGATDGKGSKYCGGDGSDRNARATPCRPGLPGVQGVVRKAPLLDRLHISRDAAAPPCSLQKGGGAVRVFSPLFPPNFVAPPPPPPRRAVPRADTDGVAVRQ